MSDYPKHSRTRRVGPSSLIRAALCVEPSPFLVVLAAEQAKAQRQAVAADDDGTNLYSIRVADQPGSTCATCMRPTGHGPVGYRGDAPICDRCLLEASTPLGLTLALVAVARAFAIGSPSVRLDASMALAELGAFARIFERVASTWGPARSFVEPDEPRA